jgi:hypothetical protein
LRAETNRSARRLLKRLARLDVLPIDKLGYLNLKPEFLTPGPQPLRPPHRRAAPTVGRRIANRSELRFAARGVKLPGA